MSDQLRRIAPLTGVVFAALLVATFALGGMPPNIHDSGLKVLAHYKAHHAKLMASDFLGALGVAFFIFFAGALRSFLKRREGGESLATVALGGAVLLGVGGAIFSSLDWALADARNSLDPSAAQAINVLQNDFFWPFQIGLVVFSIAIGLAIVSTGALPPWLGWVAVVLGILGITPVGFFAFLVLLPWSVVVSILVFLRSDTSPASAAGGSASISGQGA
jgi:hypothetical protein